MTEALTSTIRQRKQQQVLGHAGPCWIEDKGFDYKAARKQK